jgi:hypothetical protein
MKSLRIMIAVTIVALAALPLLASNTDVKRTSTASVTGVASEVNSDAHTFKLTRPGKTHIVTWNAATKMSGNPANGQTVSVSYKYNIDNSNRRVDPSAAPAKFEAASIRVVK